MASCIITLSVKHHKPAQCVAASVTAPGVGEGSGAMAILDWLGHTLWRAQKFMGKVGALMGDPQEACYDGHLSELLFTQGCATWTEY